MVITCETIFLKTLDFQENLTIWQFLFQSMSLYLNKNSLWSLPQHTKVISTNKMSMRFLKTLNQERLLCCGLFHNHELQLRDSVWKLLQMFSECSLQIFSMTGNINITNVKENAKSKRVHIINTCLKHNFDKPKFVETFSRKLSIIKPFCKIS